jgi:hypothetical protein
VSVLRSLSFFLSSRFSTSCTSSKTTLSRSTRLHRSSTFTQQRHPRVSAVSTPRSLSYCALTNSPCTSSSWRQSITSTGSPPLMLSLETSRPRHPSRLGCNQRSRDNFDPARRPLDLATKLDPSSECVMGTLKMQFCRGKADITSPSVASFSPRGSVRSSIDGKFAVGIEGKEEAMSSRGWWRHGDCETGWSLELPLVVFLLYSSI